MKDKNKLSIFAIAEIHFLHFCAMCVHIICEHLGQRAGEIAMEYADRFICLFSQKPNELLPETSASLVTRVNCICFQVLSTDLK